MALTPFRNLLGIHILGPHPRNFKAGPSNPGKSESRRTRGQQRIRWLGGIINSMNMRLSKLQKIVENREAWPAAAQRVIKKGTQLSN